MPKNIAKKIAENLLVALGVLILLVMAVPMLCWGAYRKMRGLPLLDPAAMKSELDEYKQRHRCG